MSKMPTLVHTSGMVNQTEFLRWLSKANLPIVKSHRKEEYYNVPAAFDIETSSFYVDDVVAPERKRAIMYHWQFGILGMVTCGRTWEELLSFFATLQAILGISDSLRLPVYVHNLPYEFQFMRKHFDWDKVFILDNRKPVYARSSGLEFRCMLKLAGGRSLSAVADDLQTYKVQKMVGDLDYSKIRTPLTPLTEKELKYCENDIRVCISYIMEKIEQDGDVTRIPITNTGYVRQYCRRKCRKNWRRYRNLMNELTIEPDEYLQLKRGFQGGFTHANAHYVRKRMRNVGSFDLTSAYPSVMLLNKFPMSRAHLVDQIANEDELNKLLENYCCLFDIELTMVAPKLHQDHPISSSKCWELEDEILDNGRVVFAHRLKMTITEQDYYIYKQFYTWESMSVGNFRVYEKGYLPKEFTDAILGLYKSKTELKGVDGMELEYMIAKNMLNAAYGMCVTDPVRLEYDYFDDEFIAIEGDVDSAIEAYNEDIKRFLFYPWGVWVTAYCRANLFSAIIACGNDYVYADTDSVKILNPEKHLEYFEKFNEEIVEKIARVSEFRHQNPEEYSPVNQKGRVCTIGFWDNEGTYDEFKTLGAKRYLVRTGEKYKLTVAGTNKAKSCDYLVSTGNPFDAFDNKLKIPREHTGKNLLTYFDSECSGYVIDYLGQPYEYHELSFIHMESAEYSLSLSDSFIKYLKGVVDISA